MSTDYNTVFIPKSLVTRIYDRQSVEMYPTIEMNWPKPEKNYAFMTNRSALDAQTFSFSLKIQAMASSTGTEPLVGIMRAKFCSVAEAQIYTAGAFEVVLYHSSNGMSIMNARIPDPLNVVYDSTAATARRCPMTKSLSCRRPMGLVLCPNKLRSRGATCLLARKALSG
jgi:hypothetical protein